MTKGVEPTQKVILFDGICSLCNSSVQMVIRHDSNNLFHYASLQGNYGTALREQLGINQTTPESILLVEEDQILDKSDAVLRIAYLLGGAFRLLYFFKILPKGLRDYVYNFFARNRYKWFGKEENCMIPTPDIKKKFLE